MTGGISKETRVGGGQPSLLLKAYLFQVMTFLKLALMWPLAWQFVVAIGLVMIERGRQRLEKDEIY